MRRLLREAHPRYNIREYEISVPEDVLSDELALYTMPIGQGMTLKFIYRGALAGSEDHVLVCTFPGARDPKIVDLPYFVRFNGLKAANGPFLLFSDPTLDLAADLRLAWFTGNYLLDVLDPIESVVRHVLSRSQVHHVQFEGSSGGGLAALRLNLRFDGAAALVFSPQTDATSYEGGKFAAILGAAAFGTSDLDQLRRVALDRVDVSPAYATYGRDKRVYYWQNSGDHSHLEFQLAPFLRSVRRNMHGSDASIVVRMYEGGEGHLAPPPGLWERASAALREELMTDDIGHRWLRVPAPLEPIAGVQRRALSGSDLTADFRVVPGKESEGPIRVFLQSAVDRSAGSQARFRALLTNTPPGAADVYVTDPTLDRYSGLTMGCYVGDETFDVSSAIVEVVKAFANAHHPESTVCYIGHSAGGFAAIQLAELHEGAVSVTFSPTLDIPTFGDPGRKLLATCFASAHAAMTGSAACRLSIRHRLALTGESPRRPRHYMYIDEASPMLQRAQVSLVASAPSVHIDWRDFQGGHVAPALDAQSRLISRALDAVQQLGPEPQRQVHAMIFGSCVSRDTLSHLGWTAAEYVARQSFISAVAGPASITEPWHLDSAFQSRSLRGDLEGNAFKALDHVSQDIDVALIDLTDERLGVFDVAGGGTLTHSWELESSGLLESAATRLRKVEFGSQEHFDRWRSAADHVVERFVGRGVPIIVVAPDWAERTVRSSDELFYRGRPVKEYNWLFERYVAHLEGMEYPSLRVVRLSREVVRASEDNRWGLAPYHYSLATYQLLAERIEAAWAALRVTDSPATEE